MQQAAGQSPLQPHASSQELKQLQHPPHPHRKPHAHHVKASSGGASGSSGSTGAPESAASNGLVGVCNRKALRMGWKKLHFVLPLARRRQVDDALAQLAVCPKRAAVDVRNAVANARNNAIAQGADPERLVVDSVWLGRATPLRKPWFHGRGYSSIRQHRRTNLTVTVKEMEVRPSRAPANLIQPAMMRPRRERRYPRPGQAVATT